jgi:hypothetical protein
LQFFLVSRALLVVSSRPFFSRNLGRFGRLVTN